MDDHHKQCPFQVGDSVRFTPSKRTLGQYQDIERFGITPDAVLTVTEIREGCYLYFAQGAGGWPWTEFTRASP